METSRPGITSDRPRGLTAIHAYTEKMPTIEGELEGKLRELESGETRVLDALVRRGEDSEGGPALFLVLTLTNPPAGHETWPTDDIWALRERVREAMASVDDVTVPWFITFQPEDPGELEPEDLAEQLDA